MKDVSKMHTTAEDTHEVEKDETNVDKEKKEVENLFAEKGWTVRVSRNRMRSRKVAEGSSERPLRLLHIAEFKDYFRAEPEEGSALRETCKHGPTKL